MKRVLEEKSKPHCYVGYVSVTPALSLFPLSTVNRVPTFFQLHPFLHQRPWPTNPPQKHSDKSSTVFLGSFLIFLQTTNELHLEHILGWPLQASKYSQPRNHPIGQSCRGKPIPCGWRMAGAPITPTPILVCGGSVPPHAFPNFFMLFVAHKKEGP